MELVLNTFGTCLNRDTAGFVITNQEGRQRIPAKDIKSIQIGRGAQITSDAVMLAIDNEIDIIFTDQSGHPKGRIWSPQYGSISTIRKGQLAFTYSSDALVWIKGILLQKMANQQALLLMLPESKDERLGVMQQRAIDKIEEFRVKLREIEDTKLVSDVAVELRGFEGMASKYYFEVSAQYLPEEYRFGSRTQHPARDPFNAFLNYGYGVLYGKIEGELIRAGIDPYIGVLHRDDYNRPVLVYDVIEIYRIWVDYVVCNLVCQRVITDEYYSIRSDDSCWLETLGRRVLIQSLNDYLEEQTQTATQMQTRNTQLQLYAQNLAQQFKQYL